MIISSLNFSVKNNKHFHVFFILFIILAPLLADIITGLFDVLLGFYLPFGIAVRLTILLFTFYLVIISSNKLARLILFIMIFYISLLIYWLIHFGEIKLAAEIKSLSLIILPFLIFHSFSFLKLDSREYFLNKITLAISLYGFIASLSIVICYLLNIGYESYGDYAFGFKGVFISGNDIGIAIVLSSAIAWYRVCVYNEFLDFISAFVCFIGLVFIASRAGIVFGLFFLLFGLFTYIFFTHTKSSGQKIVKAIVTLGVAFILIIVTWLSIKFADDIFYHTVRLLELLEGVSPRKHLEFAASQVFESLTFWDILFGQGDAFYKAIGEEHYLRMTLHYGEVSYKKIEKDFHDLFGHTGIIFTLFYIFIISVLGFNLIKQYFKERQFINLVANLIFVFLVIHAVFAGHVIFGSQVPILAAVILYLGINTNARKR